MMKNDDLFFPLLTRRFSYPLNHNGEYYSDYKKYRQHIRQDCKCRCVYCDSHENENGGAENMNLDHFRPKSLPRFVHLSNKPDNLVWACGGCNRLKGNHWPDENLDSAVIGDIGFIDPFESNYKEYFSVDSNGNLVPRKAPATYMLGLLVLNRPTKSKIRELRLVKFQLIGQIQEQIDKLQLLKAKICEKDKSSLENVIVSLTKIQREINKLLDFGLR
jgi:hypothetical protein